VNNINAPSIKISLGPHLADDDWKMGHFFLWMPQGTRTLSNWCCPLTDIKVKRRPSVIDTSVIFVTKIKTRTRIIGRHFQRTRTRII